GHQLAGGHDALRAPAELRAGPDRLAQHVTRRETVQAEALCEQLALRSLPRSRRSEQNEVHRQFAINSILKTGLGPAPERRGGKPDAGSNGNRKREDDRSRRRWRDAPASGRRSIHRSSPPLNPRPRAPGPLPRRPARGAATYM